MNPAIESVRRRALVIAASGTFLVLLAYTSPLGVLDHTFATLAAGPSARAWIVSGMSVGLASGLLVSGVLADALGRRRVFVVGAGLLAVGSFGAAVATSAGVFIAARLVQGLGGAALTSCSLGLLGQLFPEAAERTRATALWGASLGAGIAVGPLSSAMLDLAWSWRGGNVLCAFAAAGLVVASARYLPESRTSGAARIDWLGTLLLVVGLAGVLAGLVEGRTGWSAPTPLVLVSGGGAALVAFVASQALRTTRLLDLALFRHADFAAATAGAFAAGLSVIALVTFLPVVMSRGLARGALLAAVLSLAWSVSSVLASSAVRRLPLSMGGRARIAAGLAGGALGQLMMAGVEVTSEPWRFLPGLFVSGLATGLLNASLARQAVASVPAERASMGSGVNNTARYVGAALGMTLAGLLIGHGDPAAIVSGWNRAAVVSGALSLAGAVFVWACRWTHSPVASAPAREATTHVASP